MEKRPHMNGCVLLSALKAALDRRPITLCNRQVALLGDDCTAELLAEAAPRAGSRHGTRQIFLLGEFGRDGSTPDKSFPLAYPAQRTGPAHCCSTAPPAREGPGASPHGCPPPRCRPGLCGAAAISSPPASHVARRIHHKWPSHPSPNNFLLLIAARSSQT